MLRTVPTFDLVVQAAERPQWEWAEAGIMLYVPKTLKAGTHQFDDCKWRDSKTSWRKVGTTTAAPGATAATATINYRLAAGVYVVTTTRIYDSSYYIRIVRNTRISAPCDDGGPYISAAEQILQKWNMI